MLPHPRAFRYCIHSVTMKSTPIHRALLLIISASWFVSGCSSTPVGQVFEVRDLFEESYSRVESNKGKSVSKTAPKIRVTGIAFNAPSSIALNLKSELSPDEASKLLDGYAVVFDEVLVSGQDFDVKHDAGGMLVSSGIVADYKKETNTISLDHEVSFKWPKQGDLLTSQQWNIKGESTIENGNILVHVRPKAHKGDGTHDVLLIRATTNFKRSLISSL